ncbi:MAG: aminopeptidase [Treponema sp.]|uniref:aminopeptidase n=1 Tax=Treponema sp. TaxID=166 RepID=UPI00298DAF2D|nr:aminopeptidase [Treponema sp.]MBR5933339.1 aminopeptidase [Treponema sp.]
MKETKSPSNTVINTVCKLKKSERIIIVANPETNVIAQDLYTEASDIGAKPVLIFQPAKKAMDYSDPAVVAALKTEPDVFLSISHLKLGKDEEAVKNPYELNGEKYDNTFDYLLNGKKTMRAVWTPGITEDMFNRTVNIDYALLAKRCEKLGQKFENALSVHITSPAGTDLTVPVDNRKPFSDNGDFSKPGTGGNIPAGEVFISPVVGKPDKDGSGCNGTIVFDGSMTFGDGDSIIKTPINVTVKNGFVKDVKGGQEAERLLKTISEAESKAVKLEKEGGLPKGMGEIYKRNARNIGELGIGLNPSATITGNMLEDEKAFRTCHFAIGQNYDGDAPSLIHLDGVVKNPTIVIKYKDGSEFKALEKGELKI